MNGILNYLKGLDWRFINTFAPWFSAFGTILAVVVSLRLARSQTKTSLRIQTGLTAQFPDVEEPDTVFVIISNLGLREVEISSIWWTIGWWHQLRLPDNLGGIWFGSAHVPTRIPSGSSATFKYVAKLSDQQREMLRALLLAGGTRFWQRIRVVVITPRQRLERRVDKTLHAWFEQQFLPPPDNTPEQLDDT